MAKKKLTDQTTEELKATEKNLKITLFILLGLILGYGGFMSYQMANGSYENTTLMTMLPMFFIISSLFVSTLKNKITRELNKRDNN